MNAKLLIVACLSLAQVVSSDASTRAWWHFNGADGASASSPLRDYNGAFGLQLRKQGTATAGTVTYISPTTGVLPYVGTGDTPDVLSEPVAGGIRFFIPSPATASLGRSEMVGAYLLADATKSLFNYDNTGMFPEFTIEMFVRADPYDQAATLSTRPVLLERISTFTGLPSPPYLRYCHSASEKSRRGLSASISGFA